MGKAGSGARSFPAERDKNDSYSRKGPECAQAVNEYLVTVQVAVIILLRKIRATSIGKTSRASVVRYVGLILFPPRSYSGRARVSVVDEWLTLVTLLWTITH